MYFLSKILRPLLFLALFLFDTPKDVESSLSSDSSNDDEPKRKIAKVEKFVETTVQKYDAKQFQFHFRMNKKTLYMLIGKISFQNI